MKMKFRKLIAAVCAGCMLVSNISFADLPEESIPENTEKAAVQQTEELPPSDAVQPEVLPTESEPQPEEQADTPEAQEEQENQPESQQDTPAAQPEEQKQEQLTKPDTQTRQESEEAAVHPEQQPKEPKEQAEKQPEELTPEQGAPEATGEEEIIQTLEIGKALSGTLKNGEEYKARLIPEWDMELVFTLKVAAWGENAAHISLNGEEIELIKQDTEKKEEREDPEGTGDSEETEETEASKGQDITYIFEETVTGRANYDFTLTADWEITFSLKAERKENVTGKKTTQETGNEEDAPGDTAEETEKEAEDPEQTKDIPDSTETVYLPAGSLDFTCSEFEVTASFTDGVIPEGTTLEAEEIMPGTELYEQLTGITRDMVAEQKAELTDELRVLDIRFMLKGEEIEPDGTVNIDVAFKEIISIQEGESLQVIHVDSENNAELVESDTQENQITFSSGAFSPYIVFKTTASGTDTDLKNFLTGAYINAPTDGDGNYTVVAGESYTISLTFKEASGHQFPNEGSMTYAIPDGLDANGHSGTFSVKITTADGSYEIAGNTFTVENGQMTVQWNNSDPNYKALIAASNVSFNVALEGKFSEDADQIEFRDGIKKNITVDNTNSVSSSKAAWVDYGRNKVFYTATVTSKGVSTDVSISDTLIGTGLTLNPNNISLSSSDSTHSLGNITPTINGNSFNCTIPRMSNGEVITFSYSADINPALLEIINGKAITTAGNSFHVESNGDPEGDTTQVSNTITYAPSVSKGNATSGGIADGKETLNWSITYNPEMKISVAGTTITDIIAQESQNIMKYSGSGIQVEVYDSNGGNPIRTDNIPWSSLASYNDSSWKYQIPDGDSGKAYKYIIKYTTEADTTGINTITNVSNTGTSTGGSSSTGAGQVTPSGDSVSFTKKAVNVDRTENTITWDLTFNVPTSGLSRAVVTDTWPKTWLASVETIESLVENGLSVTGLIKGETFTTDTSDLTKIVITFYKDGNQNQEGLQGSTSTRMITVSLKTAINEKWVNASIENSWYINHENKATLDIGEASVLTATDTVPLPATYLKKQGNEVGTWNDGRGTELPIYEYRLELSNISTDTFAITDEFDTSLLTIYPGNDKYNAFKLFGLDQWQEGGTTVTYTTDQNGITFRVTPDSLPVFQDGSFHSRYYLYYYLTVKDAAALAKLNQNAATKNGIYNIENKALWNGKTATSIIPFTYDGLTKEILTPDSELTKKDEEITAQFRITLNPGGQLLNGGEPLTMTDTVTNLSVDIASITANPSTGVSWDMSGNTVTYTIPDATKVVITYTARVIYTDIGDPGDTIDVHFSNQAEMKGYHDDVDKIAYRKNSGSGSGSIPSVKLMKYRAGDMTTRLTGAVFALLDSDKNPVTDKNGKPVTFTTDDEGIITVVGNEARDGWTIEEDQVYYLRETKAPIGYKLASFDYQFTVSSDGTTDYEHYIYHSGDTMSAKNYPGTQVPVEKVWTDGADQHISESVTVQLQQKLGTGEWSDTIHYLNENSAWTTDGKTLTLNKDNSWSGIFVDLPLVYDEDESNPQDISYQIKEIAPISGYSSEITGNATDGYTVTNTPQTGSMKIRKVVKENGSESNLSSNAKAILAGSYTFGIYLDQACETSYQENGTDKTITLTIGSDGEAVTSEEITNLPARQYWIKEITPTNGSAPETNPVSVMVEAGKTGDQAALATISNNIDTGSLTVKKAVSTTPTEAASKTFYVTITNSDGKYIQDTTGTLRTTKVQLPVSSAIPLTVSNLPIGTYTVEEQGIELEAGTNGSAQIAKYYLSVTNASSNVSVTKAGNAETTITNTYSQVTGTPEVKKSVTGYEQLDETDKDKTYTFKLADENTDKTGYEMTETVEASTTHGATASFGTIKFYKPGTYYFSITEQAAEAPISGMTYDLVKKYVKIVVSESNGVLQNPVITYGASKTGAIDAALTVKNVYSKVTYTPMVQKSVAGDDAPAEAEFTFTLAMDGRDDPKDGETFPTEESDLKKTIKVNETATFGTITYTKPGTYVYSVTESIPANPIPGMTYNTSPIYLKVTVGQKDGGSLNEPTAQWIDDNNQSTTNTIKNTYQKPTGTAKLQVSKAISGNTAAYDKDYTFTFTLAKTTGVRSPDTDSLPQNAAVTVVNGATGSFDEISYTEPGTYTYTITETSTTGSNDNALSIDNNPRFVKVIVDYDPDDNSKLKATSIHYGSSPDDITQDSLTVTNKYSKITQELEVQKAIKGQDAPNETYNFSVTPVDGSPTPAKLTASVTGTGKASFGLITIEGRDLKVGEKVYTYEIKEVAPENSNKIPGMDYSTETITATVTVTKAEDGKLSSSVSYKNGTEENNNTITNRYTKPSGKAILSVSKEVIGDTDAYDGSEDFTFTLEKGTDESPMPTTGTTVTVKDGKATSFGEITLKKAGETYYYKIKETEPTSKTPGMEYDTNEKWAKIVTAYDSSDTSKIIATITYGDKKEDCDNDNAVTKLTVKNKYSHTTAEVQVIKQVTGDNAPTDATFSFTLENKTEAAYKDGQTLPNELTKNNIKNGDKAIFGEFTYSAPGTYVYHIKEDAPENNNKIPGMTYSTQTIVATVEVTRDVTNGKLNAEVSYSGGDGTSNNTITNQYNQPSGNATISVKKIITGNDYNGTEKFTFTLNAVSAKNVNEDIPEAKWPQVSNSITIGKDETGNFNITGYTVPGEYTYTLTETPGTTSGMEYAEAKTITVTVEYNDTKTGLAATVKEGNTEIKSDVPVVMTNKYSEISAPISVKKSFTGRDWTADDAFEFILSADENTPMPVKGSVENTRVFIAKDSTDKTESFGTATYNSAGTYIYKIKEIAKTNDGITYDTTEHTATVTVTRDDTTGALQASVAYDGGTDPLTVSNSYSATGTSVTLKGKKTLTGRTLTADEFTLELYSTTVTIDETTGAKTITVGDKPIQRKQNDVNGLFTFDAIEYNTKGIYTYRIKEQTGTLPGVAYATNYYDITVTVTDNLKGALQATVTGLPESGFAEFINDYKTGNLTLKKIVTGNASSTIDKFTYTVTLTDPQNNGIAVAGTYGGYTFDDSGKTTVQVSAAATVTIRNLPAGLKYTVTETTADGYTQILGEGETNAVTGTISSTEEQTVQFTNKKESFGDLAVTKVVAGNTVETNKEFVFTVQMADTSFAGDYTLEKSQGTKTSSTIKFENGNTTFTLKGGETGTIKALPNGMKYTVTETDYTTDGYVTTVTGDTSGTIEGNATKSVTFTNTKNTNGSLTISKTLEGNTKETSRDFDITITLSDGKFNGTLGTGTNAVTFTNGVANITLRGGQNKVITGLPNGIGYTVTETPPAGYKAAIITNATGNISSQQPITVNVTNTYNTVGRLKVTKTVAGNNGDKTKEFAFTVTLSDRSIQGTKGEMSFTDGVATFTLKDGESKEATGLQNGIIYTVTETDCTSDGYVTTKTNDSGTIAGNRLITSAFTNTKNLYGGLKIQKATSGNDGDKREWFAVKVRLGKPLTGIYGDVYFKDGISWNNTADSMTKLETAGLAQGTTVSDGWVAVTKNCPIVITGLPAGITYSVQEADYSDLSYSAEYIHQSGEIAAVSSVASDVTAETIPITTNLVTITNTRDTYSSLKVEKTLAGDAADASQKFRIRVTLNDPEGNPVNDTFGDVTYINGIATINGQPYIELRGGQNRIFKQIPKFYQYTVEEYSEDAAGYVVTYEGKTGTIGDDTVTATVINKKNHKYGGLKLTKYVTGTGADRSKQFEFTITLNDKTVNGEFGDMTFTNGVATALVQAGTTVAALGLREGIEYTITERDYSADGYVPKDITNDTGTIQGIKEASGGQIELSEIPTANTASFTNEYNVGDMVIKKVLDGNTPEPKKQFHFTIVQSDNKPKVNGTYSEVVFTNGSAELDLKGGETKKIENLPGGFTFTVTETSYADDGYTTRMNGTDTNAVTITIPRDSNIYIETANTKNTYGGLSVKKTVTGNTGNTQKEFTFTLVLSDSTLGDLKTGMPRIRFYDHDKEVTSEYYASTEKFDGDKGSYTFTLKDDFRAVITGLDNGITYTLNEKAEDGYDTTAVNDAGVIKGIKSKPEDMQESNIPDINRSEFTNNRDEYGSLTISKSVAGNAAETGKEYEFTIQLTNADGTAVSGVYSGVTFDSDGKATVELKNGESRIIEKLANGTKYTVTETNYDTEGYITYSTGYKGKVLSNSQTGWFDVEKDKFDGSTDDNAELKQAVAFVNMKFRMVFTPEVRKKVEGLNPPAETYTFTLTDKTEAAYTSGEILGQTTATVTGEGTASFGEITYTRPGTYVYEIKEVPGDTRSMVYASGAKKVTITVVVALDEATGEMTQTVTYADGDGDNKDTITNTYTELISAAVHKVWMDDENQDGKRPVTLTVRLLANGQVYSTETLTAANNWTLMKKDLPKVDAAGNEITYTWQGVTPARYTLESTMTDGILTTLTNVYTPEKTSASVRKVWDDRADAAGMRPDSIEVQLFADGKAEGDPVTLNEANGWAHEWNDLDKNRGGKTITYTVEETEIPEGYTMSVRETSTNDFVITNKITFGRLVIEKRFRTETKPEDWDTQIEIPVNKIWDDFNNRDGNRPESINVRLYADGVQTATARITEADGWAYTFRELPKYNHNREIRYTISEDPVELYQAEIHEYTVINRYNPPLMSVSVRKVWDDNDNEIPIRPKSIRMTLNNGTSVLLNAVNGWAATVSDLPAIVNGEPAQYVWIEQEVPGYRQTGKSVNGEVTTFTNKVVKLVKVPLDQPQPKVPGAIWFIFEEYDTALGGEILINHVGDCFD